MDELGAALADVSNNCLRGQPVPDDLAALWKAQFADETELLDAFEMTLLDAVEDDVLFEGFGVDAGVEVPVAAAFDRMVQQVCWVAEVFDGCLVGYWVGEGNRSVDDSPVVVCDADGQFEIGARTLSEYLLECCDPEDPDDFDEVRDALEALGIDVRVRNHEEIWNRVEGFDDPNGVVLGYVVEERMRG